MLFWISYFTIISITATISFEIGYSILLSLFSILNEKLEMFLYELGHYIDAFYTRDVTLSQKCLLKMTKNVRLGWPVLASLTLYQRKKNPFFILFKKSFRFEKKKKVFCFHLHLSNLSGNKKDEKFNKNDRRKEGRNVVKKGLSNKNVNPNYLSVLKAFSSWFQRSANKHLDSISWMQLDGTCWYLNENKRNKKNVKVSTKYTVKF